MEVVHSSGDDEDDRRCWKNTVVVHSHCCHHLHHCNDQTRTDQQFWDGSLKEAEVVRIDSCHNRGDVGMNVRMTREDGVRPAHHTQVFSWAESGDNTNVAVVMAARMEVCHGTYCLHHQRIPMYDGPMDDVHIQLYCRHSHHIDPRVCNGNHSNHHELLLLVVDAGDVDETMAVHNLSNVVAAGSDRRLEIQSIHHARGSCDVRTVAAVDSDGVFQPHRSEVLTRSATQVLSAPVRFPCSAVDRR